ncbi:bifunctional 2-C-methyl-D-erythritol 4-phosphate cytidylyltransferase/2-C-methyl-D-erythritol 2,4-cyclodiphosphate synthase [Gluconobacter wancherniae]|uniref:bifunctional 2-C-methyl-D-erythritol 4-phosphate cytidylyltransferase/2-C-methyl-D-erythritol 2,4-cyclodiphosphate synthase n=1 Tax=Gluconobacter wancherniae TaxID=1307955 RepID=UPI001B8BB018|nr:bifunctional 2-C-methyl-D-erythritol 4-phosphate cytidylyltransferase/2-C-methyl-D-erythritol 2,4-cyclodiphosphate synthase [Gluconobacter wancherniae]MBS1087609.1 bifunctional 2-C-methyl-D-erythritol 4-phosphate cytidylyltransferase/2-C-methyl-D-erythritol 2,4-cyclodiphosphate synthase [Gluconobacter wancherniae]
MRIAALLLAAGRGRRFDASPSASGSSKQFRMLRGKPVIRRAALALMSHVDVLLPVGDDPLLAESLAGLDILPAVAGGAERHDSVRAGLEALALLPEPPDLVLVHDGARPCVPAQVVQNVIDALKQHEGVIPAVAVIDTIKSARDGVITGTVPRDGLWRAQTPQGFRFQTLLELHRTHRDARTDDAALLEQAGHPVAIVAGSEDNIKLTVAEDLMRLEGVIDRNLLPRVGLGYDVHAFEEGRKLILCGIEIPHTKGLAGHSDADVGIHTLCDAIYGALAEGDIGRHFPPTDNEWKDMDSARFLVHAGERIRARGAMLVNADITLICERPKIGPHAETMRQRLADLLQVKVSRISVKATTSERLGFTGREEGIAATATVSIMVPEDEEA